MSLEGFPRALDSAHSSPTPSPLESAEALFIRRSPQRDADPAAGVKVVVLKKRRHATPPPSQQPEGSTTDAEDRAPRIFRLQTAAPLPQPEAPAEPALAEPTPAPRRSRGSGRIGHDTRARLIRHVLVEVPPPPAEEPAGQRAVDALRERMKRLDALLADARRAAAFSVAGAAEGWAPP